MTEPAAPAPPYSTELILKLPGEVSLSERLPGDELSTQLLSADDDAEDIGLEIGHCTDPDMREVLGYFVELSVYHQHDPETGRVFHSSIIVHPTRGEMVRLRDFLEFLLRTPE